MLHTSVKTVVYPSSRGASFLYIKQRYCRVNLILAPAELLVGRSDKANERKEETMNWHLPMSGVRDGKEGLDMG